MKATHCGLLLLAVALACSACAKSNGMPRAYYPFDGNINDASGRGHDAIGQGVTYEQGKNGLSARLSGQTLTVENSPELQLSPGLTIDCWVYFDEPPTNYQPIITKDKEYLLRVDNDGEGGKVSFFVYLDGWEPRVSVTKPQPDKWHHLVATWTGNEAKLVVDGESKSVVRAGSPMPSTNSVVIGGAHCRLDDLRIFLH
jgi:hypothetical protein